MTLFLAGAFVGSGLTYAWLYWECERAAAQFQTELVRKVRRQKRP